MAKNFRRASLFLEWSKFLVFKMGNKIGFTSPLLASLAGMLVWFIGWIMFPGAYAALLQLPMIGDLLTQYAEVIYWINFGIMVIMTYVGLVCWCRVAVICMPTVFDRYKIRGIPF